MALPQLTVAPSAAKRVRHHDCWVFKDELTSPTHSLRNGELVELADRHGAFLAYALYSAHSHIAARVVSTEQRRPWDRTLLAERLTTAIARRATLLGTNAKRLVFSAEGLPSLTQVLDGTVPERIRIEEDGLQFWVDPYHGQKTGFYLDQRQTRQWVRQRVRSGERVVDVCAYTGAFGIGAASRGAQVVCVEQDEGCLTLAKENAQLNQVEERMGFVAGDAFYWLKAKAESAERFDWVLLDPPSLAKSKADTLKGRQALHHLLVHALGLLAAGGTLALSVCTYHLLGLTEEILRIAAAERGVRLRILAVTMQANDHPWILQMPMTRYLMSWMAQRDG
ncbi:MAG: class I SAM-dependent rRNA methyltransferase [Candidatus Omnitrophica bacterium]|nr:class I SAM-dependent rRNA methyltransferase [Candidatus Omnitrophota bacterium]